MTALVESGFGHYISQKDFPDPSTAPEMSGEGHLLNDEAYDDLRAFTAIVHRGEERALVTATLTQAQILSRNGGKAMVPPSWLFEARSLQRSHPRALAAQPGEADVVLLIPSEFHAFPAELQSKLLRYDLYKESIGLPHSISAYNMYENTSSNLYTFLGGQIFVIKDNGVTVGYIVEGIFSSYVEHEIYMTGTKTYKSVSAYAIRFNAEGVRIDSGGGAITVLDSRESFDTHGLPGMANLHRRR